MEREPASVGQKTLQVPSALKRLESVLRSAAVAVSFVCAPAVSPTHGSEVPPAAQGTKEASDEAKLLTEIPSADIKRLIDLMDEYSFSVREAGQKEILRRIEQCVQETGKLPIWLPQLKPNPVYSKEVNTRLGYISDAIGAIETRAMVVPTSCPIPNKPISVKDILHTISKELGCSVEFYGASVSHNADRVQVRSQKPWQIIRDIRLSAGRRFYVINSLAGCIDLGVLESDSNILTASHEGIYASLSTYNGSLQVFTEPKVEKRSCEIVGVRFVRPDGSSNTVNLSAMEAFRIPFLPLPGIGALGDMGTIEVDIELSCNRMRTFSINDVDEPTMVKANGYEFRFSGVSKQPDSAHNFIGRLTFPGDSPRDLDQRVRCMGEGAKGERIASTSSTSSLSYIEWGFWKERPTKVLLYIPDDIPVASLKKYTYTLSFSRTDP